MNPEPSKMSERDERLGEILAAWIEAAERGQAPDSAEWLARHAEFAAELKEFLANRARLQEAAEPLCQAVRAMAAVAPSRGETPHPMSQESTSVLPASEMIGRSVGEHDLLEEIGQGGMGLVYRARHRRLQRLVALKMLRANVLPEAGDVQRFRNEAEVLAQLDHPHIIPVHDVGEHEGRVYFSMKLIEGGGLDGQLDRFRDDPHGAARLLALVARAVHHAHQRGILHRDLKPSNILLDREGQPHVSDFGLAKRIEADASLTQTGAIVGTPSYMAPEQTRGQKGAVTTATDVYGLGAVLYALLTGRPPFQGETVLETLEQVREREPQPPRRINPKVDRDLETICLKCLHKEPQRRYESAQALADDLRLYLEDRPIRARRPSWLQRVRRWFRRYQTIVTTTTMTLVVTLSLAIVLLWRAREGTLEALHDVKVQRQRAEERELLARRQLYAAHIAAAQRAWMVAELGLMRDLLEQHIPRRGEEDMRGFEWYYLWGLLQGRKEALRILRGHKGEVYCVQFSPDGKLLATSGQDRTIRLWDAATGEQRAVLRGHTNDVNWVSFAPEGGSLASASDDGTIKLWDLTSGRETSQILKGTMKVIGVAYSPDGKLLAAGLDDGTVRWWDRPSGRERPPFRAHEKRIEFITFSPDSRMLATKAENAKLWDAATGKLQRLLPESGSGGNANVVCFNHRGDVVAAPSVRARLLLWDVTSGSLLLPLANAAHSFLDSAAFSTDDRMLATASRDGTVRLWDTRSGHMLDLLTGHAGRIWCVAFSPDGRTLSTAGKDGIVRLWDLGARHFRKVLQNTDGVTRMAFSPDGKKLFGSGYGKHGGKLNIWEIPNGRLEASAQTVHYTTSLAVARDGKTLATGHLGGLVTVWDRHTLRPRLTFQAEKPREGLPFFQHDVSQLAFTFDNKTLLTNGSDCVLRQWDVSTGNFLRALPVTLPHNMRFAYSPRGNIVATSTPQSVVLWDLASDSLRSLPWADSFYVDSFSPDGALLAGVSGNSLNSLVLCDLTAQRASPPPISHRGTIIHMAFAPDGKTVASLGSDGELKLWSTATGQELLSLEELTGQITSFAFSPDGRTLAVSTLRHETGTEDSLWLTPDGPQTAEPASSGVNKTGR